MQRLEARDRRAAQGRPRGGGLQGAGPTCCLTCLIILLGTTDHHDGGDGWRLGKERGAARADRKRSGGVGYGRHEPTERRRGPRFAMAVWPTPTDLDLQVAACYLCCRELFR